MSKSDCLLETDGKPIGYVYSGSRTCPGPRPMVFRHWCTESATRHIGGSYCMSYHELVIRGASTPRGTPGGPR